MKGGSIPVNMLRARLQRLQGKTGNKDQELAQQEERNQEQDVDWAQREERAQQQNQERATQAERAQQQDQERAQQAEPAKQQEQINSNSSPSSSLLQITTLPAHEPFAQQWSDMSVQLASNEFGSFLLRTLHVDASGSIGMHAFGEWQQAGMFLNAFHPDINAQFTEYLFLDLETTGLGSGAGNVPFMVGLAFWDGDGFTVQQALIRHPAEERAMLAYIHHLTAHFTHLVTYNGKSFDWPLMHSRFVMNGMRQKIWEPLHVDLLHPSRAIWRNTLESCKLSHIEKMRLGIVRVDDLPGSEAPARYFQFLNDGHPDTLLDVFRHNEIDMLSLVTLAIRFGHLLSNRDIVTVVQQPSEPEEMVRTGLWLEKMGATYYSEQLFQLAVHIPRQRTATLMLLAMRDKKVNNINRALHIWETIITYNNVFVTREQVEAAIELSMYYEHKVKQLDMALQYAEKAQELLHDMVTSNRRSAAQKKKELEQLEKRLARLKKKCNSTV